MFKTAPSELISVRKRDSNLELLRIILMFLIIAHHYVVNSGLTDADGPIANNLLSPKSMGLLIYGAWGKVAINCFVLITGYFTCKMNIPARKFFKLLFEVLFYNIIIGTIFIICGYTQPSISAIVEMFFPFTQIAKNFTGTYLLFFLCLPFLNILVHNMTEKQHFSLLITLGFIYVFLGTIPYIVINFNYVTWFSVIYLIAAFIRLYPKEIYSNRKFWGRMLVFSLALSICSIVVCTSLGVIAGPGYWYIFVTDCNTFLAVATSICFFMYFKNLDIVYNSFINTVASTTFGVFLIHTNTRDLVKWLWIDTFKNTQLYSSPWLPLHALGSVLVVFVLCSFIDYLRIQLIEKPFFRIWDKHWPAFQTKLLGIGDLLFSKLHIGSRLE